MGAMGTGYRNSGDLSVVRVQEDKVHWAMVAWVDVEGRQRMHGIVTGECVCVGGERKKGIEGRREHMREQGNGVGWHKYLWGNVWM